MRIGVLGGSFNPVHNGHVEIALRAISAFSLDKFYFVLSGNTPHKGKIDQASLAHRWAMLRLACQSIPNSECLSIETDEYHPNFTADTIKFLISSFPDAQIYLIMGSDTILSLPHWYNYDFINENVEIICFTRNGFNIPGASLFQQKRHLIHSNISISAAMIRKNCSAFHSISDMAPIEIEKYIYASGFYFSNSVSNIIEYVKEHEKPSRFEHTVGVAITSVKLAEILHYDPSEALISAFLHDIAKDLPINELNDLSASVSDLFEANGIIPVLHAPAGAVLSKQLFGINDRIFHAILLHCTLDEEPSLLDKIIYIADMIEPGRTYPSANRLRTIAGSVKSEKELDELIILAIQMNLCYISNKEGVIHPASFRALQFLQELHQTKEN